MTAPDFVTEVTEVVSYGETTGFILKDITGNYNALTNPGGWGDPNHGFYDILKAIIVVTPYKGDDIVIVLSSNDADALWWGNAFDDPTIGGPGLTIDKELLGLTEIVNGYWKFKSYYWFGYYSATHGTVSGTFELGEIVRGVTSGATGYLVEIGVTLGIAWIQGTWANGEAVEGLTSGASVYIPSGDMDLIGEIVTNEVYSYLNNQSILTATRNVIRKQPLDIVLPRINEKQALYVSMADFLLETLDDAVEVGQIENYITIFDFLQDFINRIDETYCID